MTQTWPRTFNRVRLFAQPGAVEQAGPAGVEVKALGFRCLSSSISGRMLDPDAHHTHVSVCVFEWPSRETNKELETVADKLI